MKHSLPFDSGFLLSRIGLGTYGFGQEHDSRKCEISIIREAIDRGVNVFDTADEYAAGNAQELLGEATRDIRDSAFIVSKFHNCYGTKEAMEFACNRALKRLKTDYIDLFMLHSPGAAPIEETVEGFERLREKGLVKHFGISNFYGPQLEEVMSIPGYDTVSANQILYNLSVGSRDAFAGDKFISDGKIIMAFSILWPTFHDVRDGLLQIANKHQVSMAQVAVQWVLRNDGFIALSKCSSIEHLLDLVDSESLFLSDDDIRCLQASYDRV